MNDSFDLLQKLFGAAAAAQPPQQQQQEEPTLESEGCVFMDGFVGEPTKVKLLWHASQMRLLFLQAHQENQVMLRFDPTDDQQVSRLLLELLNYSECMTHFRQTVIRRDCKKQYKKSVRKAKKAAKPEIDKIAAFEIMQQTANEAEQFQTIYANTLRELVVVKAENTRATWAGRCPTSTRMAEIFSSTQKIIHAKHVQSGLIQVVIPAAVKADASAKEDADADDVKVN